MHSLIRLSTSYTEINEADSLELYIGGYSLINVLLLVSGSSISSREGFLFFLFEIFIVHKLVLKYTQVCEYVSTLSTFFKLTHEVRLIAVAVSEAGLMT